VRAGESTGRVTLRWKYVPTALASGEVVLTLKVSAHLAGDATEEPRVIDVDVQAL
jgi:hypothetical protein